MFRNKITFRKYAKVNEEFLENAKLITRNTGTVGIYFTKIDRVVLTDKEEYLTFSSFKKANKFEMVNRHLILEDGKKILVLEAYNNFNGNFSWKFEDIINKDNLEVLKFDIETVGEKLKIETLQKYVPFTKTEKGYSISDNVVVKNNRIRYMIDETICSLPRVFIEEENLSEIINELKQVEEYKKLYSEEDIETIINFATTKDKLGFIRNRKKLLDYSFLVKYALFDYNNLFVFDNTMDSLKLIEDIEKQTSSKEVKLINELKGFSKEEVKELFSVLSSLDIGSFTKSFNAGEGILKNISFLKEEVTTIKELVVKKVITKNDADRYVRLALTNWNMLYFLQFIEDTISTLLTSRNLKFIVTKEDRVKAIFDMSKERQIDIDAAILEIKAIADYYYNSEAISSIPKGFINKEQFMDLFTVRVVNGYKIKKENNFDKDKTVALLNIVEKDPLLFAELMFNRKKKLSIKDKKRINEVLQ